jgi:hypothetical protein
MNGVGPGEVAQALGMTDQWLAIRRWAILKRVIGSRRPPSGAWRAISPKVEPAHVTWAVAQPKDPRRVCLRFLSRLVRARSRDPAVAWVGRRLGVFLLELALIYGGAGFFCGRPGLLTHLMILSKPADEITHPIRDLTWLHSRRAAGGCRSCPGGAKPLDEFEGGRASLASS